MCDNPSSSSLSLERHALVSVARCYCVGVVARVWFVRVHFRGIPLCCWHVHNTISVWTIVRPEYSTWRFSFTILPYYSTALVISKNFQILSRFNVNEMGSHLVIFLLYLNIILSWSEDVRSRPKHVAKCHLILIIASCLMYVVYWRCIIYYTNLIIHNGMPPPSLSLSLSKKYRLFVNRRASGIRLRFISAITKSRHQSIFWASLNQSLSPNWFL